MQKNTHKACRRYGIKLCQSEKCPVMRRNYPPGIHGTKRQSRKTEYGLQLAEKQKAKIIYGLRERQFRNYYQKAIAQKGNTGQILQQFLEMRLDNAIYRTGLAKTRHQARQLVSHGFFLVNGKKVDIPSYQLRVKDEISLKPTKEKVKIFADLEKRLAKYETPAWLSFDPKTKMVKIISQPGPEAMEQSFSPRLIVEFYSK